MEPFEPEGKMSLEHEFSHIYIVYSISVCIRNDHRFVSSMAMLKQHFFRISLEVERLAENETKSFLVVVVFNLPHLRHGSL